MGLSPPMVTLPMRTLRVTRGFIGPYERGDRLNPSAQVPFRFHPTANVTLPVPELKSIKPQRTPRGVAATEPGYRQGHRKHGPPSAHRQADEGAVLAMLLPEFRLDCGKLALTVWLPARTRSNVRFAP